MVTKSNESSYNYWDAEVIVCHQKTLDCIKE